MKQDELYLLLGCLKTKVESIETTLVAMNIRLNKLQGSPPSLTKLGIIVQGLLMLIVGGKAFQLY